MSNTLQRAPAWPAELQQVLDRAAWLVLVGPLPHEHQTALLEQATQGGRPVLLIDPRHEMEEGDFPSLTICTDLLATEASEQAWYVFNDSRRNGTKPLDQLRQQWPNLQLLKMEMRPAKSFDAIVNSWLAPDLTAPATDGVLWLPVQQASTVLACAGEFLERISAIWLDDSGVVNGWDHEPHNQLEECCHRLIQESPTHQLWQRDEQRHLEHQLQRMTDQRNALQTRVAELEERLERINLELDEILALIDQDTPASQPTAAITEENA